MQKSDLSIIRPKLLSGSPGFTLVELLIVIAILGAIATLVIPRLMVDRTDVFDKSLAPAEMMEISNAFGRFVADCAPTSADRTRIGQYGLQILMECTPDSDGKCDGGWSIPAEFDPDRGKGWRGPYIHQEGQRTVYYEAGNRGQPQTGSGAQETIFVVTDPFSKTDDDEHYYRVLYEPINRYLALVYVGKDGLESRPRTSTDSPAVASGMAFEDCFINSGDDVIRPLSF